MKKIVVPEKGSLTINGHEMSYEMMRSKTPSIFGIHGSRIYELNLYRDGTLTADYNRKWLRVPYVEDEESQLAINELINRFGKESVKKKKGE